MYLGVSFVCIGKVSSSIIISFFFDSFTLTNYYPNGVDTTLRRGAYFWGHFGAVIIDVEPVSDCGYMDKWNMHPISSYLSLNFLFLGDCRDES